MARGFIVICLIAMAAAATLSVWAINRSIDFASGLNKGGGSTTRFASRDQGSSLVLQRSGNDAWGFFEWPEKKVYGFFSGSRKKGGDIRAEIRTAGPALFLGIPARMPPESLPLRIEGGGSFAGDVLLTDRGTREMGMEVRSGMMAGKARILSPLGRLFSPLSIEDGALDQRLSFFHVESLRGKSPSLAPILDRLLRRGKSPADYARDRWADFKESRASIPEGRGWPSVFVERQYLIAEFSSIYSIATERYVFEGGAHGNTAMLIDMIDMDDGKMLSSDDLFVEGWKNPVAGKLREEALRLLSGAKAGRKAAESLVDYGFFEDRIIPSANVFICESGVGFHYDRYQLAPYSFGDFTFVLPWKELEGLLKDSRLRGKLP
jgi:hypothetical protein